MFAVLTLCHLKPCDMFDVAIPLSSIRADRGANSIMQIAGMPKSNLSVPVRKELNGQTTNTLGIVVHLQIGECARSEAMRRYKSNGLLAWSGQYSITSFAYSLACTQTSGMLFMGRALVSASSKCSQ